MTTTERTPAVDEMAIRLLWQGRDSPHEIVVLTDADLLALDGVDAEHVAPLPWLGKRDRTTQEIAAELGWRQLAARGLAATAYEPEMVLHVSLHVEAALQMRRASSAIVLAQQETSFGVNTLALYGQGALGVLVEAVDGYGLHRFTTMQPPAALDALLDFAVPTGAFATNDGTVRVYGEAEWATAGAADLSDAIAVTVVSGTSQVRGQVVERRLSLYAMPDRAIAAVPLGDSLGVRAVSRDTVVDLIRDVSGSSAGGARRSNSTSD